MARPNRSNYRRDRSARHVRRPGDRAAGRHVSSRVVAAGRSEEPLSQYLQVRVPDLERTRAERNEPLLSPSRKETGGIYYDRLDAAIHGDGAMKPLSEAIASRAEVKLVKGAPRQKFAEGQMQLAAGVIAGSLFIEWIVRRLNRLA